MTEPAFPDNRLAPYVRFHNNAQAFFPEIPYALTLDGNFIDHIILDKDGERVWIMKQGQKSHVRPLSILNQVSAWKCELVA